MGLYPVEWQSMRFMIHGRKSNCYNCWSKTHLRFKYPEILEILRSTTKKKWVEEKRQIRKNLNNED